MILGVFLSERTKENTPMTLDQSVLSELLAAFQSGEGLDLIRESVRLVCQELIETELHLRDRCRALRADRGPDGRAQRASFPDLSTKAGDVELAIPKLRQGSFFPSILEPRRRIDLALYAVVMEAYVHGVSTRAVDDLVAAMGSRRGSQSPRSVASVPGSTRRWGPSGRGASTTSASPTSGSTPPTCTYARSPGDLQGRGRRHRGDR